jgi:hypothetical protein
VNLVRFILDQRQHCTSEVHINPEHVGTVMGPAFQDPDMTVITTRDGMDWFVKRRLDDVLMLLQVARMQGPHPM